MHLHEDRDTFFFFFQAEDGIRDYKVTGVQTCALPICVTGDTELFDYFAAAQVTAQAMAGVAQRPVTEWAAIQGQVTSALFTTFPSAPTATGRAYLSVIQNLTGGPRPLFDLGVAVGGSFAPVWGVFGSDGSVNGILNQIGRAHV